MPTRRPRMMITISPELDQALKEFSQVSGVAASSFAVQILTESLPTIRQVTQALRQAKNGQHEAFEALQDALVEVQAKGSQLSLEITQERKLRRARGTLSNDQESSYDAHD